MSETTRTQTFAGSDKGITLFILGGLTLLLVSLSLAISVGAVHIPFRTVWGILINKLSPHNLSEWMRVKQTVVVDTVRLDEIDLPAQPEFIKSDIQASDIYMPSNMALVTLMMLLSLKLK